MTYCVLAPDIPLQKQNTKPAYLTNEATSFPEHVSL